MFPPFPPPFPSSSLVSNGLYQRKDEGGITSGTHASSHSQISDYNTLEGRDYEEIDMGDDKHDYHHLQRPSPPLHISGRNQTFQMTPPNSATGGVGHASLLHQQQELHSMSTLTSQLGNGIPQRERELLQQQQQGALSDGNFKSVTLGGATANDHIYRELEQTSPLNPSTLPPPHHPHQHHPQHHKPDIYRSPTNSDSPDSARLFGGGSSSGRGTVGGATGGGGGVFGYPNESLYSPTFDLPAGGARVQKGGLENVPETGTVFDEPANPTAFPVHNYEKIERGAGPEYEQPISTKRKTPSTSSGPPVAAAAAAVSRSSSIGGRPRASSNASTRYETELPQQQLHIGGTGEGVGMGIGDESQYSKLVRPVETPTGLDPNSNSFASPFYAELGTGFPDVPVAPVSRPPPERPVPTFSHSSAELSRHGRGAYPGKIERGFTMPSQSQPSASGYNVITRGPSSVSSGADSISAYAARLQEADEMDAQLDSVLFNESRSQPAPVSDEHHVYNSCQRNASFGPRTRTDGHRGQRAWSEERRGDVSGQGGYSSMDKSGFSSSAMGGHALGSHIPSAATTASTKMHRDLRTNGFDPRLGECVRTKTMV